MTIDDFVETNSEVPSRARELSKLGSKRLRLDYNPGMESAMTGLKVGVSHKQQPVGGAAGFLQCAARPRRRRAGLR